MAPGSATSGLPPPPPGWQPAAGTTKAEGFGEGSAQGHSRRRSRPPGAKELSNPQGSPTTVGIKQEQSTSSAFLKGVFRLRLNHSYPSGTVGKAEDENSLATSPET
ncbi:uncharacterized protein ACOB8E_008381 [Sarcophilus harrisii]